MTSVSIQSEAMGWTRGLFCASLLASGPVDRRTRELARMFQRGHLE
ncbi:hypothetical protein STIAU_2573 [Stigmatella aurantiaca DW4/3-1]|uniref:Uncharacterized protein n=1 Tax=Stigmatella aurantiaca (strain DW4/3-1) TaxID=378806 RepID=Q08WG2_STIAD|nr:hypothetical protein STIAU_2573 [Stigmatella aurantiaca DW4/3-1]